MSFFTTNWSYVTQKCPALVADKRLPPAPEEVVYPGLTFFPARTGLLTAKLNETNIHSTFDPLREAEKIIATECEEEISVCIFYGCGLGYYIKAFTDRYPHIPAIIVEPDPVFFLAVIKHIDLSSTLAREQVLLYFQEDPEGLGSLLQQFPLKQVKIITLRPLYAKDEKFYRKADKVIQSILARKEINLNTLKRFGKLWVRNLLKNMTLLACAPGLAELENYFEGLPALVLASGPTLDLVLPRLPALRERFLIISVDTSLKACLDNGLAPDFTVVVDPQYWNTRHLDGLAEQPDKLALLKARTLLLAESSTHPAVFTKLPVPVFLCSSYFPLGQYFEQITGAKGKLGAGGSVATAAWDLARFLGTRTVFIAGLDLGYPASATHFKGAFFENTFHTLSSRLNPASSLSFAYIMQAEPFYTSANTATPVLTDIRMQVFRSWFQSQLKERQLPTYNLSPTGVKIEGMPYKQLTDLESYPVIRPQIDKLQQQLHVAYESKAFTHTGPENAQRLIQTLEELEQDFLLLAGLAAQGLAESLKLCSLPDGHKERTACLDGLNRIDQQILQLGSRQMAGFLLQPLIHEMLQVKEGITLPDAAGAAAVQSDFNRVMDISVRFYQGIDQSARYHQALISRALTQLAAKT